MNLYFFKMYKFKINLHQIFPHFVFQITSIVRCRNVNQQRDAFYENK